MSITIIISEIIQQLLKGSHSEDIFEEIDNKIVSLTPIVKVSEGASTELELENSFYAEMELPKGVMPTLIVSKELYPMYLELPSDEFISRLNKTLFDYINEQLIKDRKRGVHDADNIWLKPNAAFVNWFHEEPSDINFIESFISSGDTKDGIPIFLSKWAKEVVRLLLKNGEMKHQDIILALKDLPPSYNHISKIFRISKAREFLQSEIVNNRSYYSLKNPTDFKK